ncbi:MAG: MFS transporter [Planctomycetaceae bacterium]|nr:MFS transporter [Planctomycetaceae bacterium]
MSKPAKASLLIIFVTVFIDLLGFGIVLPLLPRYGEHFAIHGGQLGLLMSCFSLMQFLFAPVWGRISDRIGRRPVLIVGLVGSTVCYGLFGLATSLGSEGRLLGLGVVPWLFITRIGAGIAGATIPTAQAYIADLTGARDRAKGMALIGAAFGIGFTFGPLLGAGFVTDDPSGAPSAMPGYIASALSGVALLSAIFVLKESLSAESKPTGHHWLNIGSMKRAIERPAIGMILLTMFLTTFAFAQFESTLALLTERFGLSLRDNFYVFAYIGFLLTLCQGMIVRRLVPRIGEYRMALVGVVLMAAGLLLVGLSAHQESKAMLFSVLPVTVLGFSAMTPSLQALLSLRTPDTEQGGILGLGQSVSAMARILGPWLGMTIFERGTTLPYFCGAGVMLLGLVCVSTLKSPAPASTTA